MAGEVAAEAVEVQPEATPVDGGAVAQPTGEPGGEQQPTGGGEATPEGAPKAAGDPATPPSTEEHHVPWARFREAQTGRTQAVRQLESEREQWKQRETELTGQLEQAQGGDAQTQQMVADYYHIAGALQRHPDLAQELDRRVVAEQGTAPAQPTTRQPAQPTTPPPWAQKLGETVEQVNQRLTAAEQAQLAAHQRAESAKTEKELDAVCTKFLEDRGYDRSFLEDAKEYVLKKAEKEMPDLELEDVPYVLSAWFKNTDGKIQARVNSILEGKRSDAGLPPSPGSAHTAVRPAQAAGANDGSTAQQAEEALRRLGWSND